MSELAGVEFGDPERVWIESAADSAGADGGQTTDADPAPEPPDLTEPEEFFRRVDLRRSWFAVPALILLVAVVLIALPFQPDLAGAVARQIPSWVLPVLCWTVGGIGVVLAAYVLLRDPRMSQQAAAQEAYAQFLECGVLGRVVRTSLVLRSSAEGASTRADLVLDVRGDRERMRRLERAFDTWLQRVASDRQLRERVAGWVTALDEPVASERIFGADAAGGYLIPHEIPTLWAVILPVAGTPAGGADTARLRSRPVY